MSTIFVVADVLLQHLYFLDMGKCMISIRNEVSVFRDVVMLGKNKITVVHRETDMGRGGEGGLVIKLIRRHSLQSDGAQETKCTNQSADWISMYYLVAQA